MTREKKNQQRADGGRLLKQTKTDEGYYRVDGYFTRVGVFDYFNDDGSIRKELRPPEEVLKNDSLASFAGKPITDQHPEEFCGPDNVDELQVGTTGNDIEIADNGHVRIKGNIHSQDGINAAESGKTNYSGGYKADILFKQDTWTNPFTGEEERFDAIQTNIRGNHVALVDNPRGGDKCGFRFDGRQGLYRRHDGSVTSPQDNAQIAPLETDWDGDEARGEIQELSGAERDNPNEEHDDAFLWVPDNDNLSDRIYPYMREVDGELQIVPQAVFSIVSNLRGGRDPAEIPEEDKNEIWEQCRELYARFRDEFDDFDETLPESRTDSIVIPSNFESSGESSYVQAVLNRSDSDSSRLKDAGLTAQRIESIIDSGDETPSKRLDEVGDTIGAPSKVIESAYILDRWKTGGEMPNVRERKDSDKDGESFEVEIDNKIYDSLSPDLANELQEKFDELEELKSEKEELEEKVSSVEAERDKLKKDSESEDEEDQEGVRMTKEDRIDYANSFFEARRVADSFGIDVEERFDGTPEPFDIKKAVVKDQIADDKKVDESYVESGFDHLKKDVDDKTPSDDLTSVQHGDGTTSSREDGKDSHLSEAEKKRREYQDKFN